MTEGSRPSPKSAMKVVMNIRVIMVTAEHYFSYVRLLLVCTAPAPIGSPGKVAAIFTESGAVILKSESCQELLQQAIHQGTQTHVTDQVDGIYVLRPASMTTIAHVRSFSTSQDDQDATSGLYAGYTRPGLH